MMKTSLDHLPASKQRELEHIKTVLMREFEAAVAGGTQAWRRNGKINKLILFGSFARNDWVDEPQNGYQSDWDLLVIVSHEKLTDIADYWFAAEDKLLRDPEVKRQVNIIVHTLQEVNEALSKGRYFWVDIIRDGVLLYDQPGSALAAPMPPTPADAYEMAKGYYDKWWASADRRLAAFELEMAEAGRRDDPEWLKDAAFTLHQAAERLYACYLLAETFYFPRSHNLKFLRSLAEDKDRRLIDAWPRETKSDRRRFELLKRAYVEARYSPHYEITPEELAWLAERVAVLLDLIKTACEERLADLAKAAGL